MASAELSHRVEKVVGYEPLSALSDLQRREFHEELLEAGSFEDLPGKWQAAILSCNHRAGLEFAQRFLKSRSAAVVQPVDRALSLAEPPSDLPGGESRQVA